MYQRARLWATSDFVRRFDAVQIPQAARAMYQRARLWATSDFVPHTKVFGTPWDLRHGWTWGFPSSRSKPHTNTPQQNSKRQKAQTPDEDNQAQSCDRRRRIDRIHIPYSMESFISECYPTFLADSDQKLVLLGLRCPSAPAATRRKRCPIGFLCDEEEVAEIKSQLQTIPGEGEIWWDKAPSLIRRRAVQYETKHTLTGFTEPQVLVMESTRLRLCPQAWHYLWANGYPSIPDPASAYSLLAHMAESQQRDRSCAMVLDKLKTLMHEPYDAPARSTRQEVWRLVKQLQSKRKLMSLRHKTGQVLCDPHAIASEIASFWQQTMSVGGQPLTECHSYLASFFKSKNIPLMAEMLIKPLSAPLVHAALLALNRTSAPGLDGVPCSIYASFAEKFSPVMHNLIQGYYRSGTMNEDWALALLNVIPKTRGTVTVKDLRPLVLQNTCHKWIASCVSLQLQDFIAALTPVHQKGFIKGRCIFDHLWNAFGSWSAMQEGLFCPIDFRKAYDSVAHSYAQAFFTHMCLPTEMIQLLMLLFKAPMALIVHGTVMLHEIITPTSGIRQGCPLSPSLFAVLISPISTYLMELSPTVTVLLYADDLLIIIRDAPLQAALALRSCIEVMKMFSQFCGLQINHDKGAILIVGPWETSEQELLDATGINVQTAYTYLGVKLGYVAPEEAFAPALQKALGRAPSMQHWNLTLKERVFLLKMWILPVLVYPARVIFPVKKVVDSLKTIYNIALGLNSWGLTQDILALPESQGGLSLAQPHYFLWWHHSALFVNYTLRPAEIPPTVFAQFEAWAGPRAITVTPAQLGWFQMDINLPWISLPYLAFSAKSFLLLRQGLNVNPPDALSYDMPLWHNVLFKNAHFHTYSSPSLIREGILTVGQLLEDDSYLNQIAPTWRPIYRETIGQLANQTFVFSEHSR